MSRGRNETNFPKKSKYFFSIWHLNTHTNACQRNIGIFIHTERLNKIKTRSKAHRRRKDFTFHLELITTRKLSRICALFKAYSGERAWKRIGDRLRRPHYLSRVDHGRKIRSRRQRTDIGEYSFANRTVQHWNQSSAEVLVFLPCKPITFKKRVRKVITELN